RRPTFPTLFPYTTLFRSRFAKDRDAFTAARGMLRGILGRYLDYPPGALRFDYTVHGKPSLPGELGGDRLRFNLSHSHGLALCAVDRKSTRLNSSHRTISY